MFKNFLFLCLFLIVAQASELQAQSNTPFSHNELASLIIQDGGRLKPLDTYARNTLLKISGKSQFEKKSAIDWLSRVLFADKTVFDDPIFLIHHPNVKSALKLPSNGTKRFSFNEIKPEIQKLVEIASWAKSIDEKELSAFESEVLRLHYNLNLFVSLSQSFSFVLPHTDFQITHSDIRNLLALENKEIFSFIEIMQTAHILMPKAQKIRSSGNQNLSESDIAIVKLASHLSSWAHFYQNSIPAIFPPHNNKSDEWLSPWQIILSGGLSDEHYLNLIISLTDAIKSYHSNSIDETSLHFRKFNIGVKNLFSNNKIHHIYPYELFYNKVNPFFKSKLFYIFALVFVFLSFLILSSPFRIMSLVMLGIGSVFHLLGLILRMYIMGRPPVSTLYETFIFVSFVAVLIGLLLEFSRKNKLGLLVATLTGLPLLYISGKYLADGDTLGMLVAVLDSNFWLSTHVITITIGYAGSCLAGIVGHIYLIGACFKRVPRSALTEINTLLLGTVGFGLTFSFIGTVLGGIWADQSWGRFWGWDPKENGALLIVLWLAMILHAKPAQLIGPLGTAIMGVLTTPIVMLAWFGVNLLGVGLHSYGFTKGAATNLTLFVLFEVLFCFIMYFYLRKRSRL